VCANIFSRTSLPNTVLLLLRTAIRGDIARRLDRPLQTNWDDPYYYFETSVFCVIIRFYTRRSVYVLRHSWYIQQYRRILYSSFKRRLIQRAYSNRRTRRDKLDKLVRLAFGLCVGLDVHRTFVYGPSFTHRNLYRLGKV